MKSTTPPSPNPDSERTAAPSSLKPALDPTTEQTPMVAPAIRPSFWTSFGRSQVASVSATVVDFGTLFLGVEILKIYYVVANVLGATLGAVTNFLIGRHWSFEATHFKAGPQALRYALVSAGSLVLNTSGVYALTEWGGLKYGFSKAIVALLLGFFFNFPLHRRYVFK